MTREGRGGIGRTVQDYIGVQSVYITLFIFNVNKHVEHNFQYWKEKDAIQQGIEKRGRSEIKMGKQRQSPLVRNSWGTSKIFGFYLFRESWLSKFAFSTRSKSLISPLRHGSLDLQTKQTLHTLYIWVSAVIHEIPVIL